MRGSLRPGGQLRTDPAHVRFGPLKRGSCRYALPVSLLSSSAAEVRVGELRGGARLHLELVEGGTFKVVLEATRAAIVEATLLFTSSSGGSLAIPVSARILEPTLFHARANSLHVEREPPPSGSRKGHHRHCHKSQVELHIIQGALLHECIVTLPQRLS